MRYRKELSAALSAALTLALSFAGVTSSQAANSFASDPASVTVTEQTPPVAVSPNFQITSSAGFSGKYVEATLNAYSSSDQISLIQDSTVSNVLNAVSIVNNEVWVGKGGSAEKVGQVDSTDNGNGKKLRVNFISTFGNSGFEDATTISPWTSFAGQVNLGTTVLAGFQTYDAKEGTAGYPRAGSSPSNDNTIMNGGGSFSVQSVTGDKFAGQRSLELKSQSLNAPGHAIVHGPAAWSAEFPGASGQQLSFAWRANSGQDNYHVWAALLRTDGSLNYTQRWTEILYATGNATNASTTWAQSSVTIPATGTYRFVFVAGSQDYSGGSVLGATLYIDDVQVLSSSVPQAVAAYVARKIAYQNTSDAPVASRTMTITGVNELNESANSQVTINITAVDDDATAQSTISYFVNTAASDSFQVRTGTISATDVDGDALTLDIPSGSADVLVHAGTTYDKKTVGTYGTFWVDQQSLRWAIVPSNEAIDGVQSQATEDFSVRVISSGQTDPDIDVTVSARVSYDMKAGAPTIRAIYSEQNAAHTSITYDVEFDEYVDGFTSSAITLTGTSGASGWIISEPQLVIGTTKYRFIASNVNAVNGTVDFTLAVSQVRDFAYPPNQLSSATPSGTDSSAVTISRLPSFDVGTNGLLGATGSKISPNFDLSSWGSGISGIRVEITNAQPGDELVFSNAGGVTGTSTASGSVLLLSGSTALTDLQWETAIRSVTFSTSNNAPVARNIQYHLKPTAGYDYETGTLFEGINGASAINQSQARALASATYKYGLQGYLATPDSPSQTEALNAAGMTGTPGLYLWLDLMRPTGTTVTNNSGLTRDVSASVSSFTSWQAGQPQMNPNETFVFVEQGGSRPWHDAFSTDSNTKGYFVEYGLRDGDNLPAALTKTQSHQVDLTAPTILSVSASSETYGRGESVDISVQFSEPVVTSGTPVSRIEILPGVFADYVSGSGSDTLVYRYVVQSGVTSSDLSYVSTSSLQIRSQTIRDSVGNNADVTLPAPGAAGSLVYRADVVIDGTTLRVKMTTAVTASSQVSLQFVISASVNMDCSSITASDFNFQNLSSSSYAISPGGNSTSCAISVNHTIPKASFGTAQLAPTTSFEITLADTSTHSNLIITRNSILVNNPADPGKGEVILDESNLNRARPGVVTRVPATQIFPGGSAAAADALASRNVLKPGSATFPELEIRGDFRSLSSMVEVITARREKVIRAGDQVVAKMQISASEAASYKVISYINVGSGFLYSGERDFDISGEVSSEPLVFTQPGEYIKRMYVVARAAAPGVGFPVASLSQPRGSLFPMQTRLFAFAAQTFSTGTITEAQLSGINSKQSLELVLIINQGDSVTVTNPPAPAPTQAPSRPSNPSPTPTPTLTPTPTVTPTPTPTVTPSPTVKPTPTPTPTPKPSVTPTPSPSPTPAATPSPTPPPTATPTPTPTPTAQPEPTQTSQANPETQVQASMFANLPAAVVFTELLPEISFEPGSPVANPALGATGDDDAEPVAFDPMATTESIAAVVEKTTQTVAIVASVAAAAAASAGAAAAAGAAAGAASAGSAAGSSGGSSSGSSSNNSNAAGSAGAAETSEEGDISELEVAHESLTLEKENWGDRLAIFALPFMTFLDRFSHNLVLKLAPLSPMLAKVVNDGAYLRAITGSLSILTPVAAVAAALLAIADNGDQILIPTWELLLVIALLGVFDAFAGFAAAAVFMVGSVISAGGIESLGEVRMLLAVMVIAIGPALLTTAFRTLRREPAHDVDSWWERISDLAVAPFMAGWSVATMVSVLPAVSGLTVNAANHIIDFGVWVAVAAGIRVLIEEFAARYYPARLNAINPDEIPDPPIVQKILALAIKYAMWIVFTGALVGPGWQVWLGSALFLLPSVISWFQDRFPNFPILWRVLPTGVPGLAFSILLASFTTALVTNFIGISEELMQWSFVLLPLPMLVYSLLGMFARQGVTEDEDRPVKRFKWVYRIGGAVMMYFTLQLVGIL